MCIGNCALARTYFEFRFMEKTYSPADHVSQCADSLLDVLSSVVLGGQQVRG